MQASLGCVATAGIPEIDPANFKSKDGKEIISQGRNMSFFQQKTLRLRRLYDSNQKVMVYVAYSTRLTSAQDEGGASTGRYKYAPTLSLSQLGASAAGGMKFMPITFRSHGHPRQFAMQDLCVCRSYQSGPSSTATARTRPVRC